MAYVGEIYRIHYIARDFAHALTDVRMVVYKPNGIKQGIYTLSELNAGDGQGIYYYDYENSDIEGTYLFVVNSPSTPKKDARQVFFEHRFGWTDAERRQIRDALGVDGDKTLAAGGQLQNIDGDVNNLLLDTTTIKNGIVDLNNDLFTVGNNVLDVQGTVNDIEGIVNNIHIDVGNVAGDVTYIKNAVDDLGTDLAAVAGDVTDLKADSAILVADVQFIKNIEGGKWEIKNNQMIFYKADNTTEVARFNLYNDIDSPAMENVFKRTRV